MGTSRVSIVQWLLASLCGLYCVHGLRVSSLCHIAHCQRQLPRTVFDRVMDFFPPLFLLDLSSPFSPSFPSGHLVSIVRLPDKGSHLSFNSCICVDLSFFIILPQAFVFSFFVAPFFFSFFFFLPHAFAFSFFPCLFSECFGF